MTYSATDKTETFREASEITKEMQRTIITVN